MLPNPPPCFVKRMLRHVPWHVESKVPARLRGCCCCRGIPELFLAQRPFLCANARRVATNTGNKRATTALHLRRCRSEVASRKNPARRSHSPQWVSAAPPTASQFTTRNALNVSVHHSRVETRTHNPKRLLTAATSHDLRCELSDPSTGITISTEQHARKPNAGAAENKRCTITCCSCSSQVCCLRQ